MQHLIIIIILIAPLRCLASTVSASVECSNGQSNHLTTYGTTVCDWAVAMVQPTFVMAQGIGGRDFWGAATAELEDDVVLTISGRTGEGLYLPCFNISGIAAASLGSFSMNSPGNTCSPPVGPGTALPFVFDTALSLHLTMVAAGGPGSAFQWVGGSADLQGFQFFDVLGNPIDDVTYVLSTTAPAGIPEPAPSATVGLGLMAISALTILRRRRATLCGSSPDQHRDGSFAFTFGS